MKVQYCSDLHLEFAENEMYMRSNPLIPTGEILLLAGDIGMFAQVKKYGWFLDYVSANFKMTYWIPGNHEYYHSDISERSGTFFAKIRHNVLLINNDVVIHNGIRFIFSTLWSKISQLKEKEIQKSLGDFLYIQKSKKNITVHDFNKLHADSLAFISNELVNHNHDKTIVVTHHIPTFVNYPEKYLMSSINEAFATELKDFVKTVGADYWLYGHHHINIEEFSIGKTRLITNQLGYVENNECLDFRFDAVFDI